MHDLHGALLIIPADVHCAHPVDIVIYHSRRCATYTILIQALGFIALVSFVSAYQFKSNRMLFIMQGIANVLFAIQFACLGGLSGSIGMILNTIRNVILLKHNDWRWVRRKGWVILFILLYCPLTYYTWDGWISLFPLFGFAAATIGNWTNNAQKIRLANLVCACPCWLIFNAYIGSIGGVLNESIAITSILISIYRYGWKEMGKNDSDFQK